MKRIGWAVIAAGVILAAAAFQNPPSDEVRQRDIQTLTGTVKSYSPENHIVVVTSDGTEHSLRLDAGARVAEGVAEGQMVAVAWLMESNGRQRVTSVAPFSAPPEGGSSSSAPPSKAYASSTEGSAMSTTPVGPMSETPRPVATTSPAAPTDLTPGVRTTGTPGASVRETPGPPPRRTPMGGSR
jgi:hypothetical protein